MASAEREPITRVGAEPAAGSKGRASAWLGISLLALQHPKEGLEGEKFALLNDFSVVFKVSQLINQFNSNLAARKPDSK